MMLTCSMLIAVTLTTGSPEARAMGDVPEPQAVSILASAPALTPAPRLTPARASGPVRAEAWTMDRSERRPGALPAMYAALGALQIADVYSTRKALGAGAYEANPLMGKAAGSSGAMLAVKALSAAGTIYFAERAWKKNRKGAVILMAVVNGVTAAVAARNFRNAQR